jgi:hypothetical protein
MLLSVQNFKIKKLSIITLIKYKNSERKWLFLNKIKKLKENFQIVRTSFVKIKARFQLH